MRIAILFVAMLTMGTMGTACGPVKNPGGKGDRCEFIKNIGQRVRHTCGRGLFCHKQKDVCMKDTSYLDTSK